MPSSRNLLVIGATAITAVLGFAPVSVAQAPPQGSVDELTNHEGVFLDAKSGKIAKAKAKNEDWIQIAKSKAVELGEGAVIFRWGDKLYLIEGDANAPIHTMKPFQDNGNVSYLKDLTFRTTGPHPISRVKTPLTQKPVRTSRTSGMPHT